MGRYKLSDTVLLIQNKYDSYGEQPKQGNQCSIQHRKITNVAAHCEPVPKGRIVHTRSAPADVAVPAVHARDS